MVAATTAALFCALPALAAAVRALPVEAAVDEVEFAAALVELEVDVADAAALLFDAAVFDEPAVDDVAFDAAAADPVAEDAVSLDPGEGINCMPAAAAPALKTTRSSSSSKRSARRGIGSLCILGRPVRAVRPCCAVIHCAPSRIAFHKSVCITIVRSSHHRYNGPRGAPFAR